MFSIFTIVFISSCMTFGPKIVKFVNLMYSRTNLICLRFIQPTIVKLWFTNLYFVGFYFVPNLIVIIFNLVYPIFIVGFDCKGCVCLKESVKTQASEARRLLMGVSRLSFPQSEACALHMTGMRRVNTDGDSCVS